MLGPYPATRARQPGVKPKEFMVIDDVELARALHVLFVAHWIGGVSFVTLVALPLARAASDARKGGRCSNRSRTAFRPRCAGQSRSQGRRASG